MSWLFSRALVAEYLPVSSSESEPCAPLSVMPTPHKFWCNDKILETLNLSRFGLTLQLLEGSRGEDLLTLFRAGFPVRTLVSQEKVQALREKEADCGQKWSGLFAKYDLKLFSWKTSQCSLLGDSELFSETWPKSAMTRSMGAYQRPPLVPITEGNAFGFSLPTPVASDGTTGSIIGKDDVYYPTKTGMPRKVNKNGKDGSVGLGRLVKMWPTPVASSHISEGAILQMRKNVDDGLISKEEAEQMLAGSLTPPRMKPWPTPTVSDANGECMKLTKNGIPHDLEKGNLRGVVKQKFLTPSASEGHAGTPNGSMQKMLGNCKEVRGETKEEWEKGSLSADWTEWLMGFPVGWSDLKAIPGVALSWDKEPEDLPRVCKKQEYRALRLKGIGNAQVPQCAAAAFIQLMERIENE